MQKIKSKTMAILIAAILTISMGISMTLLPSASAHTPPIQIQLIAYMNVGPDICGLGQSVNLGFWLNTPPPTANGPYGDRYGPYTVYITQPDNTTTTLGPFISDDTGGTHYQYTPPEVGNYLIWFSFPGMTLTGAANGVGNGLALGSEFVNDTLLPATSNKATLTVQQTPLQLLPNTPLPTSYWQTPVTTLNVVNWDQLTGAWLGLGRNANPIGAEMYNFSSNYNPYTTAPLAAHIMWTKPEAFGGVLGGPFPPNTSYGNYYSVSQYERKYNPVIINGYLIYTEYPGSSTYPAGVVGVDLYTGQTLWTDNYNNYMGSNAQYSALSGGAPTQVLCGQLLNFVAPDQYGGLAYFWTTGTPDWITSEVATQLTPTGAPVFGGIHVSGTTYNMFDAMTGDYILSIVNGTSIANTIDASGDMIGYYVNNTVGNRNLYSVSANGASILQTTVPNPQTAVGGASFGNIALPSGPIGPSLEEWNSTQCILYAQWPYQAAGWEWRPQLHSIVNWEYGVQWSAPVATNVSGYTFGLNGPLSMWSVDSGVIVLNTGINYPGIALSFTVGSAVWAGYSTTNGQQLWIENDSLIPYTSVSLNCEFLSGDGLFITETRETGNFSAYSLQTGQMVWSDIVGATLSGGTPTMGVSDTYDTIGAYQGCIAGTNLYMIGFGGDIWDINITNGDILWYTNTTQIQGYAGYNTPYNTWPIWEQNGIGVAGGLVFLEEGHEYSPPTFIGAQTLALNATTGQLVWSIDGFDVNGLPYMAYGQMTLIDGYNNLIEDYGQGPSATTVTAPDVSVTTSTPVRITGTVMDVSAGSQQEVVKADFPNGLPAVSDASMSQFMEAVYMQQSMPTNVTGVPVTLTDIDPNGNVYTLGTTTTTAMGIYGFTWTPNIPGDYTIIATFAGSGGYYGSSAETSIHAGTTPTPAPTASPLSLSAIGNSIAYATIGIIVVIVIIGVVLAMLMPRKRP